MAKPVITKEKKPTIYIGADHAGIAFKTHIKQFLEEQKYTVEDMGGDNPKAPDDYPVYAKKVAEHVQKSNGKAKGILICGSGTGMVIAANKFKGIRAAFVYDTYGAKMAKKDNDANIITLRARKSAKNKVEDIIKIWLSTKFNAAPRHKRRLKEIDALK